MSGTASSPTSRKRLPTRTEAQAWYDAGPLRWNEITALACHLGIGRSRYSSVSEALALVLPRLKDDDHGAIALHAGSKPEPRTDQDEAILELAHVARCLLLRLTEVSDVPGLLRESMLGKIDYYASLGPADYKPTPTAQSVIDQLAAL